MIEFKIFASVLKTFDSKIFQISIKFVLLLVQIAIYFRFAICVFLVNSVNSVDNVVYSLCF